MPSEERFAIVQKLLEKNGWILVRTSGSHHIFKRQGFPDLSIPVHRGKVKPFYVRQIRKTIEGD